MDKQLKKETLTSTLEVTPSFVQMEDPVLDYIYYDLDPKDKLIFQHRTGYQGAPVMKVVDLAKKIKMSPSAVSSRAFKIAKTIQKEISKK